MLIQMLIVKGLVMRKPTLLATRQPFMQTTPPKVGISKGCWVMQEMKLKLIGPLNCSIPVLLLNMVQTNS